MNLGLVIPAYNEEKRIGQTLKSYTQFLDKQKKDNKSFDYKILVSINNTKDNTQKIVKTCAKKNKKVTYIDLVQGGKGYAIIEGFKVLSKEKYDLLGFVDADMATPPEAFYDLVKNIDDYDGVIGSRYLPGAKVHPKQSMQRIIVSRMYNFFIRSIFFMTYRDTQCGAKLFKKEPIKKILSKLTLSRWAFDVDILYNLKIQGYKIKEHPTVWSDKAFSKINFMKAGPMMVLALIRLRLLNSPFHSFMRIYDKMLNRLYIHP
jgi:glycosyltransferase involved in cell wall biosynthesis